MEKVLINISHTRKNILEEKHFKYYAEDLGLPNAYVSKAAPIFNSTPRPQGLCEAWRYRFTH
jgi:hypothetical protein